MPGRSLAHGANPVPPRGTRPRNRRQLIIWAAADLFARNGYPHVPMSQIAAAVGIGPSALYRHFAGKSELLAVVTRDAMAAVRTATVSSGDLREVVHACAGAALDHPGIGVFWQRDSRDLAPADRAPLRAEVFAIGQAFTTLVQRDRPDLAPEHARFLAWAAMSAVTSISFQRVVLPRAEYQDLIADVAVEVCRVAIPEPSATPGSVVLPTESVRPDALGDSAPEVVPEPRRRRELLLAAATRLFAQRGYDNVGIEDIGAAVGIAGPSIYHHFDSKLDLLREAIRNGALRLSEAADRITAEAPEPGPALHALLRLYVDSSLARNHVLDLLIIEASHLPDADLDWLRRAQRDFVGDLVRRYRELDPTAEYGPARVRVQAALNVTNDIARTPHLRELPGVADLLHAIGAAVLHLPPE